MNISATSVFTAAFSFIIIRVYIYFLFRKTPILKMRQWRHMLNFAFVANIVGFLAILTIFLVRYGGTADDLTFYDMSVMISGLSIFNVRNGTDFMCLVTKPLRQYLQMDLISLHLLFFSFGFFGSLNFLYIIVQRLSFSDKSQKVFKQIVLVTLLCFPNFLAWGRFYGKDSVMLFFISVFSLGVWRALSGTRINIMQVVLLLLVPLWMMRIVRPHIAIAISASGMIMIIYRIFFASNRIQNIGLQGLIKFFLPLLLLLLGVLFGQAALRKLIGGTNEISKSSVETTIISATKMGIMGGSTTELATEMNEDQRSVFGPLQVVKNVLNLLFSPMPWQIRNPVDVLALFSNMLLALLLFKYAGQLTLYDSYQKYLLLCVVFLSLLLSFMTANIGLILRQKTMLLPFVFLLLFSTKKQNADKSPSNRNYLSKPRFNP
jgi:hypothetical protein